MGNIGTGIRVVGSSNPHKLLLALATPYAAVEAEYGNIEVEGSKDEWTLNHHVREGRKCPCLYDNFVFQEGAEPEEIGISHFDLDTLGGVTALWRIKPEGRSFWELAAYVDTNGPHQIKRAPNYTKQDHIWLASFWAWSRDNRLMLPRDGSVLDCTEFFEKAHDEIARILEGKEDTRGIHFLLAEEALAKDSFVAAGITTMGRDLEPKKVVLRSSDAFANALYYDENGDPAEVVVGYNTKFKSITLSVATPSIGINAKDVMQSVFGPKAGGHPGIAGTPRDEEFRLEDARQLFDFLCKEDRRLKAK